MPMSSSARSVLNKGMNVVKKVASLPMKAVDSYIKKSKAMDSYRKGRDEKMQRDNGFIR